MLGVPAAGTIPWRRSEATVRMDKMNYKSMLETAKAKTGKQVEFLGDARGKK